MEETIPMTLDSSSSDEDVEIVVHEDDEVTPTKEKPVPETDNTTPAEEEPGPGRSPQSQRGAPYAPDPAVQQHASPRDPRPVGDRRTFGPAQNESQIRNGASKGPVKTAPPEYFGKVVQIHTYGTSVDLLAPFRGRQPVSGRGSGFFVKFPNDDKIKHVVTCAHVVKDAHKEGGVMVVVPVLGKDKIPAEVQAIDMGADVALLRVDNMDASAQEKISALRLGDDRNLELGEKLNVIGFPLGMEELKVLSNSFNGRQDDALQLDGAINPGNSGGPAIQNGNSSDNLVVGIIGSGIHPMMASNVSFAIPINDFKAAQKKLLEVSAGESKLVEKPELGIMFRKGSQAYYDLAQSSRSCKEGVVVQWISKYSALRRIGVKRGDVLCSIEKDGRKFALDRNGQVRVDWYESPLPVTDILSSFPYGEPVRVAYWQKEEEKLVEKDVVLTPFRRYAYRYIYPSYEKFEYLTFAGITVVPVSANMLELFPHLMFQLGPDDREEPHLVVANVLPGSLMYEGQTIYPGLLLTHVNRKIVTTLGNYKDALRSPILRNNKRYLSFEGLNGEEQVLFLDEVVKQEPVLANQYKFKMNAVVSDFSRK
jgi:S1-C subfamily serine protease